MAFSYIPGPSQGGPSLAQSTVSFAPPVYYTAGNNPQDVAVGDVNGDGKLDLVVANATSNDVSVLLGAGAGTFGAATTLSEGAGSSPRAVAIADLNGDAKLDLAIAHCGGSVGIRLNTGAVGASPPSFNGPTNFNVGGSSTSCPTVIATGNFNGGKPDLATANFNTDNASVLLNSTVTGSTTPMFSVSDLASAGDQPSSVALADLNGDGKLDLAVAIAGTSADRVEVRLGNGDGTFSATWQQVAMGGSGSNPAGVVAADFNGDGKPDLVTADFGHNDLSVRLNTTSAGSTTLTFGPVVNYATSTSSTPQPTSLAVADLNRDGKLDLAVANYGSGQVAVLLGNGDGTFGTAITYNVGTNPVAVATGDFNGDGWPDLVVVRANVSTNNVVVLLNQPPPTPTPTSTSTPTVTATATSASTVTPTSTPSPTGTPTSTSTATPTHSPTPTGTSTPTTTPTASPTGTPTPTSSPTPTAASTSVIMATSTPSPTTTSPPLATATPTSTPSPSVTATGTTTPAATATATLTPTVTPTPTVASAPTATATPTVTGTVPPTAVPAASPSPTPTATSSFPSFYAVLAPLTQGGETVWQGQIAAGRCSDTSTNCLTFTVTGSFTVAGTLEGLPPGAEPTVSVSVANTAGVPEGARSVGCLPVDATGRSECRGTVPEPGVQPLLGATVQVTVQGGTSSPTPTVAVGATVATGSFPSQPLPLPPLAPLPAPLPPALLPPPTPRESQAAPPAGDIPLVPEAASGWLVVAGLLVLAALSLRQR